MPNCQGPVRPDFPESAVPSPQSFMLNRLNPRVESAKLFHAELSESVVLDLPSFFTSNSFKPAVLDFPEPAVPSPQSVMSNRLNPCVESAKLFHAELSESVVLDLPSFFTSNSFKPAVLDFPEPAVPSPQSVMSNRLNPCVESAKLFHAELSESVVLDLPSFFTSNSFKPAVLDFPEPAVPFPQSFMLNRSETVVPNRPEVSASDLIPVFFRFFYFPHIRLFSFLL